MTLERMLILGLVVASVLALTKGLWFRRKRTHSGCGSCTGCGCH